MKYAQYQLKWLNSRFHKWAHLLTLSLEDFLTQDALYKAAFDYCAKELGKTGSLVVEITDKREEWLQKWCD